MIDNHKEKNLCWALGVLFIITGIICNEWALKYLFSSDGSIGTSKRILIWIFDLIMVAVGIWLIMKRKPLNRRVITFYVLMVITSVLAVEVVLNVAYYAVNPEGAEEMQEKFYEQPAFKGTEWAKGWFEERRDIRIVYKPFRMWGNNKYEGEYINLDEGGRRRTWNPEIFEGKPQKVYMLGGSTVWGYGARDEYTIPSFISKKLFENGYNFEVYNFGEFAYTFPQEIITLVLLLRDGHRPDYVITYDGINDVYSTYQSGLPGSLNNQFLIHKRLEKLELTNAGHILTVMRNLIEEYSKIYLGFKKLEQVINPVETHFQEVAHSYSEEQLKELGRQIVKDYAKSLALLDSLSKTYNFKYRCFWQPNAFTEDKLAEGEEKVDVRLGDESLRELFRYTNEHIDAEPLPNFHNISDVLYGRGKPYYFDWMHITEDGNKVVAERIMEKFKNELLTNKK